MREAGDLADTRCDEEECSITFDFYKLRNDLSFIHEMKFHLYTYIHERIKIVLRNKDQNFHHRAWFSCFWQSKPLCKNIDQNKHAKIRKTRGRKLIGFSCSWTMGEERGWMKNCCTITRFWRIYLKDVGPWYNFFIDVSRHVEPLNSNQSLCHKYMNKSFNICTLIFKFLLIINGLSVGWFRLCLAPYTLVYFSIFF